MCCTLEAILSLLLSECSEDGGMLTSTKAFAPLTTSLFWMLVPSPIIFVAAALLLDSLQRNWLIYFSCITLFFTFFSTGGLTSSVTHEPLNLESGFLWLEDDVSVQFCGNPLFSFCCFGVESASLGCKALVEKSVFGSRTENMSPSRSRSTLRWRCNSLSTDFWVIMLFGFTLCLSG